MTSGAASAAAKSLATRQPQRGISSARPYAAALQLPTNEKSRKHRGHLLVMFSQDCSVKLTLYRTQIERYAVDS